MKARYRVVAGYLFGLSIALTFTSVSAKADGMTEDEWRAVESGTATQSNRKPSEEVRFQPVTNIETTSSATTSVTEMTSEAVNSEPPTLENEDERLLELEREMLRKLSTLQDRGKSQ